MSSHLVTSGFCLTFWPRNRNPAEPCKAWWSSIVDHKANIAEESILNPTNALSRWRSGHKHSGTIGVFWNLTSGLSHTTFLPEGQFPIMPCRKLTLRYLAHPALHIRLWKGPKHSTGERKWNPHSINRMCEILIIPDIVLIGRRGVCYLSSNMCRPSKGMRWNLFSKDLLLKIALYLSKKNWFVRWVSIFDR